MDTWCDLELFLNRTQVFLSHALGDQVRGAGVAEASRAGQVGILLQRGAPAEEIVLIGLDKCRDDPPEVKAKEWYVKRV